MNIALGRSGISLAAISSMYDSESRSYGGHEIRAEVAIGTPNAKQCFAALEAQKAGARTGRRRAAHLAQSSR